MAYPQPEAIRPSRNLGWRQHHHDGWPPVHGRFRIQNGIELREYGAHRLPPFREMRGAIEEIDLLQCEGPLRPDRVRHAHGPLSLAKVREESVQLCRDAAVEQSEQ